MAVVDFTTRFGNLAGIADNLPVDPSTGLRRSIYEASDTELLNAIRDYATSQGGDGNIAIRRFNDFLEMVRGFSVVIRRATTRDILLTSVQQSDPRIAMILGAARDKNTNAHLFQGDSEDSSQTLDNIYSFMFGTSRPGSPAYIPGFSDTTGQGTNAYYYSDLFVNGIRQISASLTAAVLIGRLSQVQEQADHAKFIETQALKDLSNITETYLASKTSESPNPTQEELDAQERANVAFYFQPGVIEVADGEKLVVGYYSTIKRQYSEFEYTQGSVNVAQIASDLADLINSNYTVGPSNDLAFYTENTQAPFIATVSQSGQVFRGRRLITLSCYPRHAVDRVIAQALNVRIYVANKPPTGNPPARGFSLTPRSHPSDAAYTVQSNPAESEDPLFPPNQPTYLQSTDNKPVADQIPSQDLFNEVVSTPLPFWGINPDALSQSNNNGILITIRSDKLRAVSSSSSSDDRPPNVKHKENKPLALYIKKKSTASSYPAYSPNNPPTVTIRISSRLDISPDKPPTTTQSPVKDNTLPGFITQADVALALIDAMALLQESLPTTTITGVIFRNDDPTKDQTLGGDFQSPAGAITALELICWSPNVSQPFAILDILQIPPEFELAAGAVTTHWEEAREGTFVNPTNYISFHTRWGPPPRSIKVDNAAYTGATNSSEINLPTSNASPIIKTSKPSFNYRQILEEHSALQDYRHL